MSRALRKLAAGFLLLLLGIFCWHQSLIHSRQAAFWADGFGLRLSTAITLEEIQARKNAVEQTRSILPEAAFWLEERAQEIYSEDRYTAASVFSVHGVLEQVMPMPLLNGSYPASIDSEGCAVSRSLAYNLWGSCDVTGLTLEWKERIYTVRGVFDYDAPLLMVQATLPATAFTAVEASDSVNSLDEISSLLGLPSVSAAIEGSIWRYLLDLTSLLPAFMILILISIRVICFGRTGIRRKEISVFRWIVIALLFIALLSAMNPPPTFPRSLIPPRWSDFSFWQTQWSALTESIRIACAEGLDCRTQSLFFHSLLSLLWLIPSLFFLFAGFSRTTRSTIFFSLPVFWSVQGCLLVWEAYCFFRNPVRPIQIFLFFLPIALSIYFMSGFSFRQDTCRKPVFTGGFHPPFLTFFRKENPH